MASQRFLTRASTALKTPVFARAALPRRNLATLNLIGRLGTEPEGDAEKGFVKYVIATNQIVSSSSSSTGQPERQASWFHITAFPRTDGQRSFLMNLQKGSLVHVQADASYRQYETAEGERRSALNLVQRSIEPLARPRNPEENEVEN